MQALLHVVVKCLFGIGESGVEEMGLGAQVCTLAVVCTCVRYAVLLLLFDAVAFDWFCATKPVMLVCSLVVPCAAGGHSGFVFMQCRPLSVLGRPLAAFWQLVAGCGLIILGVASAVIVQYVRHVQAKHEVVRPICTAWRHRMRGTGATQRIAWCVLP